jgi:hypothetical protein
VANGTQYLPTFRRGFTGPAGRIGSGTEFHIDSQILKNLPEIEKIRAMDSKARQYAQNNRVIEFSNEGVAGRPWNPDAPLEEKIQLYRAATAAHAPRQGVWDRLDYYVPFQGENRFGRSVEGASIYIPGIPGGKIRSSSGGDYGYFSEASDPSGRVVFRVGHGDINRPETEAEIAVAQQAAQQTQAGQGQDKSAEQLLNEAIERALKPAPAELKSSYAGPSEDEFRRRRNQLEGTMLELMIDQASRRQEQPAAPRLGQNMSGAQAAAMGLRSFGQVPKSTI